jgi:hypothetical protein
MCLNWEAIYVPATRLVTTVERAAIVVMAVRQAGEMDEKWPNEAVPRRCGPCSVWVREGNDRRPRKLISGRDCNSKLVSDFV